MHQRKLGKVAERLETCYKLQIVVKATVNAFIAEYLYLMKFCLQDTSS